MSNDFGLGRLYIRDERDNMFPMASLFSSGDIDRNYRYWWPQGWWGNQGRTPHCVAYAWTHYLEDGPVTHFPKGTDTGTPFNTTDLYNNCQKVDRRPGENYDGTSVRAGAKVLHKRGLVKEYRWAWSVAEVSRAILELGPVVAGTVWYDSMFRPDEDGIISVDGNVVGGHAYLLDGVNVDREVFRLKNSWGRNWGHKGFAYISFDDFERLLNEYGEACIAVELERT